MLRYRYLARSDRALGDCALGDGIGFSCDFVLWVVESLEEVVSCGGVGRRFFRQNGVNSR